MGQDQQALYTIKLSPDLELAYSDSGAGNTTLLFIHGLGNTKETWLRNTSALQKTFRCLSLDLPGYGQSSKEDFEYTLPYYSQVILATVEKLKLQKVTLIGHSMGAQIAVILALKRPEIFENLVLISPSGFEKFSTIEKDWIQKLYHPDFLKRLNAQQFTDSLKSNFLNFAEQGEIFKENYQKIFQSGDFPRYCSTLSSNVYSMLDEDIFNQLSKLEMPVLIIFGTEDQMIPNQFLHPQISTMQIARTGQIKIKNSHLKMISSASHFVHWEQANQVNQSIIDFLK